MGTQQNVSNKRVYGFGVIVSFDCAPVISTVDGLGLISIHPSLTHKAACARMYATMQPNLLPH